MQGDLEDPTPPDPPGIPDASPSAVPADDPAPTSHATERDEPFDPRLPASEPKRPTPMGSDAPFEPQLPASAAGPSPAAAPEAPARTAGNAGWYRSDRDRYRSVHRRANPWYRRLARGIVGLIVLSAAGVALYLGAQVVRDFLEREGLPSEGAVVPSIRETSFEIRSAAPAPVVDGTLTLDAATGAFEFVGRGTGQQAGTQIVSPDGERVLVRRDDRPWQAPDAGDVEVNDVLRAVSYLVDDDSVDAILTRQLRRRYVDLLERIEIGSGEDELRRFEMEFDTATFRDNFPIEYQSFEERAIPGVVAERDLPVSITIDRDDVLVAVDDSGTNWTWQRLSYSDQPFTPIDPAVDLLDGTIEITDGSTDG